MGTNLRFLVWLLALLVVSPVFARHKFLKDHRISQTEASTLLARAKKNSKFPICSNQQVVNQLNRMLKTPGSRKHLRESLKRMEKHQVLISKKLRKHDLPLELLSIPLIESGYQNIHSQNGWGSGLWMFIKPTAKSYGLKIDKKTDQRLNVSLSTEAALKYLKANQKTFKNWELTLLAYNMGENRVKKAMKKTNSKNAWTLIKHGHEGDKGYLAKIMAAMIIMKNKELLN